MQDKTTGTRRRESRQRGNFSDINEGEIPGDRVPPQFGQAPVRGVNIVVEK